MGGRGMDLKEGRNIQKRKDVSKTSETETD